MTLGEIAPEVRAARRALGLTQVDLATRARVSRLTLARLETGRLPELGYTSLLRIVRAVGLDLRLTTFNQGRPTLEDLVREGAE